MKTYLIGFLDNEGRMDETFFEVESIEELSELFRDFCEENGFDKETLQYVTRVESAY